MASPCSFPTHDAIESIRETGAYIVKDALTGERVARFDRSLPFKTPEGLEFCAENSLYNKDIRTVVESSVDRPHWGFAKIYRGGVLSSDQVYFFIDGPDVQVIFVLLWAPESQFILFEGSHSQEVQGKEMSDFGILTLPRDQMNTRKGVTKVLVDMTEGGFALIDGRVGWTILKGSQIAVGYPSETEVSHWGKMRLGESTILRQKVKELNDRGIKTNFIFCHGENLEARKRLYCCTRSSRLPRTRRHTI
ncbi:hypothetical protein F4806DRAFT_499900 [Annulohypoxylon nitens]|nr:hypothetical protein F4806DRAFT_499900 [Annulohypoxylon nitens]